MSAAYEELKQRILEVSKKEITQDVDGFYYWWPEPNTGCYAYHHLRIIADELVRLNKSWQDEIDKMNL